MKTADERILDIVEIIHQYGGIDGGHHKQWVLDQIIRIAMGDDCGYEVWVRDYCAGEDGPETYEWDEGIAP
ncbi:MAG: hypothetical protein [Caudoviricetes sp.]|nr:MAG: hypothetical protein [Caudoviricetes sp.]